MEEVSIEQKAKRYDEALERVKELLSRCRNNRDRRTMVYRVNDIESIFPELKENEDERIKEDLIQWISDFPDMIWRGHYREDVIAWLDKQGKKEIENKFVPKFNVGDEIKIGNEKSLTITKIDEKGYWSEDLLICDFDEECLWDLVEQKKPVWSEEDEVMRKAIILNLEEFAKTCAIPSKEYISKCINWFKNLSSNLSTQKQWKPSDEQIKVCKEVYADILSAKGFDLGTVNSELNRLEEQLKK
jgi:hypothetical protein